MINLDIHIWKVTVTIYIFISLDKSWWVSENCLVMSDSLLPHGLYNPWNSPDQNTGVGSLSLLQGIFPTQGSNPDLLHCRQFLYQLSHKGSPELMKFNPNLHGQFIRILGNQKGDWVSIVNLEFVGPAADLSLGLAASLPLFLWPS